MVQNSPTFKAFRIEEIDGIYQGSVQEMDFGTLNNNEVLVKVAGVTSAKSVDTVLHCVVAL